MSLAGGIVKIASTRSFQKWKTLQLLLMAFWLLSTIMSQNLNLKILFIRFYCQCFVYTFGCRPVVIVGDCITELRFIISICSSKIKGYISGLKKFEISIRFFKYTTSNSFPRGS